MVAKIQEIEAEMSIVLTTGTKLKYKMKRSNGDVEITREIMVPGGDENSITSVKDIESDANSILNVVTFFRQVQSVPVTV